MIPFLRWCRSEQLPPSLTTSGGPLERLVEALHGPHNGLTISVHAGTEEVRARAVPKGPALDPLFSTLAEQLPSMSRSRRKKIALAYLVVAGLNDTFEEVDAFATRARVLLPEPPTIHLYGYNPVPTSDFGPVPRSHYEALYERLTSANLRVRMSSVARRESNGGCGTLVALRRRLPSPTVELRTGPE